MQHRINAQAACQLLQAGQLKVVDIRDQHSFNSGRIRSAKHLDNSNLAEFIQSTPKDQAILVCCYSGMASQNAASFLLEQGFTEVYSLDGGFDFWRSCHPEECE